jgi:hypothetical protein
MTIALSSSAWSVEHSIEVSVEVIVGFPFRCPWLVWPAVMPGHRRAQYRMRAQHVRLCA